MDLQYPKSELRLHFGPALEPLFCGDGPVAAPLFMGPGAPGPNSHLFRCNGGLLFGHNDVKQVRVLH